MVRPLTAGLRRLLYVAVALVALAGFQLFILTDHTARYFSWTIEPGMTAAFLGAGYVASVVAAAPRLGALNLFAAVIFGQLFCSVVLDHYGVLYKEQTLSPGRIAGIALLAAGVALVRFF